MINIVFQIFSGDCLTVKGSQGLANVALLSLIYHRIVFAIYKFTVTIHF